MKGVQDLLITVISRIFTRLRFKTEDQLKDTLIDYLYKDFVDKHIQIEGFTNERDFVLYLLDEGIPKIKFTITSQNALLEPIL